MDRGNHGSHGRESHEHEEAPRLCRADRGCVAVRLLPAPGPHSDHGRGRAFRDAGHVRDPVSQGGAGLHRERSRAERLGGGDRVAGHAGLHMVARGREPQVDLGRLLHHRVRPLHRGVRTGGAADRGRRFADPVREQSAAERIRGDRHRATPPSRGEGWQRVRRPGGIQPGRRRLPPRAPHRRGDRHARVVPGSCGRGRPRRIVGRDPSDIHRARIRTDARHPADRGRIPVPAARTSRFALRHLHPRVCGQGAPEGPPHHHLHGEPGPGRPAGRPPAPRRRDPGGADRRRVRTLARPGHHRTRRHDRVGRARACVAPGRGAGVPHGARRRALVGARRADPAGRRDCAGVRLLGAPDRPGRGRHPAHSRVRPGRTDRRVRGCRRLGPRPRRGRARRGMDRSLRRRQGHRHRRTRDARGIPESACPGSGTALDARLHLASGPAAERLPAGEPPGRRGHGRELRPRHHQDDRAGAQLPRRQRRHRGREGSRARGPRPARRPRAARVVPGFGGLRDLRERRQPDSRAGAGAPAQVPLHALQPGLGAMVRDVRLRRPEDLLPRRRLGAMGQQRAGAGLPVVVQLHEDGQPGTTTSRPRP